jgi:hypothetical protein
MSNKSSRYSIPEMLGIMLMLIGVGLGFYIIYLSTHQASTGIRNFQSMWAGEIGLAEIKSQFSEVYQPLNESVRLTAFSHAGGYIYLPGLFLYIVARRRRWNRALHENTKNTEQPGPECLHKVSGPLIRDVQRPGAIRNSREMTKKDR